MYADTEVAEYREVRLDIVVKLFNVVCVGARVLWLLNCEYL